MSKYVDDPILQAAIKEWVKRFCLESTGCPCFGCSQSYVIANGHGLEFETATEKGLRVILKVVCSDFFCGFMDVDMTKWDRYVSDKVDGNCHRDFPGWVLDPEHGAWTFRRSRDGVLSHHKFDTPFCSWETACEVSMSLWDQLYPGSVPKNEFGEAYDKISAAMQEGQQ